MYAHQIYRSDAPSCALDPRMFAGATTSLHDAAAVISAGLTRLPCLRSACTSLERLVACELTESGVGTLSELFRRPRASARVDGRAQYSLTCRWTCRPRRTRAFRCGHGLRSSEIGCLRSPSDLAAFAKKNRRVASYRRGCQKEARMAQTELAVGRSSKLFASGSPVRASSRRPKLLTILLLK